MQDTLTRIEATVINDTLPLSLRGEDFLRPHDVVLYQQVTDGIPQPLLPVSVQ